MHELIVDITDKIAGIGIFKYLSDDWGQLDDYAPSPPTKWPCCLIDIVEAKPESQGGHIQVMDCTVLIRVADLRTANSSRQAPDEQKNKHYNLLTICQTIYANLHGWHKPSSNYGTLSRTGFRRYHRDDGIREYHILFRTTVRDDAAKINTEDIHDMVPREVRPKVTVEFP